MDGLKLKSISDRRQMTSYSVYQTELVWPSLKNPEQAVIAFQGMADVKVN